MNPEVMIEPEEGILDIGACMPGHRIQKKFKIKNVSNFALDFKLDKLVSGLQNTNGMEAFIFLPSEGKIPAFGEVEVIARFQPDRVSEQYFHLIVIDVPNQKNAKEIFLRGFCYPR